MKDYTAQLSDRNKETMAKNLQRLMKESEKTRMDVCKDLGIKYTTFTDWIKAKTYPRIDRIEMLAQYFHVSKSDLIEEPGYENLEKEDIQELAKAEGWV